MMHTSCATFYRRALPAPLALALFAAALSACQAQTPASAVSQASAATPDLDGLRRNPKVQALMEKTRKNLRFVEGGSFEMGDFGPKHSEDGLYYTSEPDNKPMHKVTLSSFSMSAYKTSYEDHDVFSEAMGREKLGLDRVTQRSRFPKAAAGVNWYQAREYCQWLGALLKLPMDLPTEAQWEYAARNRGRFVLFATDNGKVEDGRNVWELDQRNKQSSELGGFGNPPSLPLGQFPPTPLGLYDMMTDGYEWTLDWFAEDYYAHSPELNPTGPATGERKVLRSSRGSVGSALAYGDGFTIRRGHRQPDPPRVNYRGQPDPTANVSSDTMARCVLNLDKPASAP
jgi:formylglycine-generating enzyme required for sulfatase activity